MCRPQELEGQEYRLDGVILCQTTFDPREIDAGAASTVPPDHALHSQHHRRL